MFKKFFADFSDREISPHSARAYYITEAIKLVGIREAQVRAKHRSVDTTALYDRSNYSGAIENIV